MKKTERYVIFWGGIFSNWAMTPFEGRVAYKELMKLFGPKNLSLPAENIEITSRLRGKRYENNEQWMMACKTWLMNDLDTLKEIHKIKDPKQIKALGRSVKPFNEKLWDDNCEDVVTAGIVAKFTATDRMRSEILDTGEREMVEGSPFDRIWGIGIRWDNPDALNPAKWRGKNLLGKSLVRGRTIIAEQEDA